MTDFECVLIAIVVILVIVLVSLVCKRKTTENASDIVMATGVPAMRKPAPKQAAPAPSMYGILSAPAKPIVPTQKAAVPTMTLATAPTFKAATIVAKKDMQVATNKIKNWFK